MIGNLFRTIQESLVRNWIRLFLFITKVVVWLVAMKLR